jgi:RES domain
VFSERLVDRERQDALLEAILNARYTDAEWMRRAKEEFPFDSTELYTSRQNPADYRLVDAWDEHKQEVLISSGGTTEFPIGREDFEHLSIPLRTGTILYGARLGYVSRSRYHSDDEPYRGADIAAPPAALASAGRANRKGQVVLYCGDQEKTAVAEVRPARGNVISLGLFRVKRDLKLLDLVMKQPDVNPFTTPNLILTVELRELFRAFGKDLASPLRRSDDITEYLPSQSLTDAVRDAKFDGIRYPSAMNIEGSNVVIFNPAEAEFVSSQLLQITDVTVQFTSVFPKMNNQDLRYL